VGLIPQSKEKFMAALTDYASGMKLSMEEAGVRGAGELCYAALELTPPMAEGGGKGLSKAARDAGYKAVAISINNLFVAADNRKASSIGIGLNKLKAAVKNNDVGKFETIRKRASLQGNLNSSVVKEIIHDGNLTRAFNKARNFFSKSNPAPTLAQQEIVTDLRKIHLSRRYINNQGKMRTSKPSGGYLGKYVVESKDVLKAYIETTQSHVGFIKSGWWEVLSMLPKVRGKNVFKGSEIPVWIKRHAGTGYATLMRNSYGIYIRIGNSVGDNDNQATKNDVQGVARALAMARLFAQLEAYQKDKADNFNSNS
jgi:hypothetical protein